jgi:hypothetical protein
MRFMTQTTSLATEHRVPTRREAAIFRFKTFLFQVKRSVYDLRLGDLRRFEKANALTDKPLISESKTQLWTESDPEERALVAGKIHNLRLAVRKLDGIDIEGGKVFSFWKHIGRTSRLRGFVQGRELREGCVIPNIGGGLCQLSNALYDAALEAGFEIIERHAHTQVIAGSLAEQERDATVFWNYVDLRFRSTASFRIEARLDGRELIVRFMGEHNGTGELKSLPQISQLLPNSEKPRNCMTCEVNDCHRVVERTSNPNFGNTAFLVDEFLPEFDKYIHGQRASADSLFVPIDGGRFRKANYAWSTAGYSTVEQSYYVTAARSYSSRKLAAQGASRQLNLLRNYKRLAESYARRLTFDVLHIVVQQDLLPFLWEGGHLGGRSFDVLMTALPMNEIQSRLDFAKSLHPESKTLADFRADEWLVEVESEALKNARTIITPHSDIAFLFPKRAKLIDWEQPAVEATARAKNKKPIIVFPASTVGRKGCYELRQALKGMEAKLIRLGPDIEADNFWYGFDTERGGNDAIDAADVIVLPAFIEHRPRRLIRAAATGIPVIASTACGLGKIAGIETVDAGDSEGLREKIMAAISSPRP